MELNQLDSYFAGGGQKPGSEIFRVSCVVAYCFTAGAIAPAFPISRKTRFSLGKCLRIVSFAISGVTAGSPADKGGLKGGDRIIEFGGRKITNLDDFDLALRRFSAGDEVKITALRAGKEVKLTVTLGKPRA